jgi:hypothetical protein
MLTPFARKTIYLIVTVFMIGWLIFWATRPEPLPHNVQRVGNALRVDVCEGATDDVVKKNCLFVIPEAFHPKFVTDSFIFNLKLPDGSPLSEKESTVGDDIVMVAVSYIRPPSLGFTGYLLKRLQPKDGGLKNVPFLVESRNGLDIYQYDYGQGQSSMGTIYSFVTPSKAQIIVDNRGEWSKNYRAFRKLSGYVELDYTASKKQDQSFSSFVSDVTRVDNAIVKTVQSFQSK